MRNIYRHFYVAIVMLLSSVTVACIEDDRDGEFSLSCGDKLTIVEGETELVSVRGTDAFTITTDNDRVSYVVNENNTIVITGVKVGDCLMTVKPSDGEQLTCTITVLRSAAQKDFEIISIPRVENWLSETVNTETTPGLQVTFESGINAAGQHIYGVSSYGFYFTETGAFCRISARGSFAERGVQADGMVAIYNPGEPVNYFLCEKLEVVNILNGKLWIVASIPQHPDLRIVTEVF